MIRKTKWEQLLKRMLELGITEEDLNEKFIIGSGSGGQKLHKTASCVYLRHIPSGLEVKCQESRFREQNRYYARVRMCDKLEEMILKEKSQRQQLQEKIRRQKRRRSRRTKQKILEEKHHRSRIKSLRSKPETGDE